LDSVNNLALEYQDLRWLPVTLPPHVHFVITTVLEGELLTKAVTKRGTKWTQMRLTPISEAEKLAIVTKKLMLFGKTLTPENIVSIGV